ncbi:hypothetical protein CcCBS67573_g09812 [Chytriomyces confervae]|uniref:Uncharacterized protein n=1 Tax=Chytriomyces confervae TaxID=246404 RepID=A0A507DND6_9FUNG|nr:hypothetical protein CcCBS67573_g09812 [Chytriomyces confervae]
MNTTMKFKNIKSIQLFRK